MEVCSRCGSVLSPIVDDDIEPRQGAVGELRCNDLTCPFSDRPQKVAVQDFSRDLPVTLTSMEALVIARVIGEEQVYRHLSLTGRERERLSDVLSKIAAAERLRDGQ